jgi:hypothetical protein
MKPCFRWVELSNIPYGARLGSSVRAQSRFARHTSARPRQVASEPIYLVTKEGRSWRLNSDKSGIAGATPAFAPRGEIEIAAGDLLNVLGRRGIPHIGHGAIDPRNIINGYAGPENGRLVEVLAYAFGFGVSQFAVFGLGGLPQLDVTDLSEDHDFAQTRQSQWIVIPRLCKRSRCEWYIFSSRRKYCHQRYRSAKNDRLHISAL